MKISVAVFAYNEEKLVRRAVRNLLDGRALNSHEIQIHILANGCTDNTLDIVNEIAKCDSRVVVHNIEFADKSNAWNYYLYNVASDSDVHCFTDGDCFVSQDALFMTHDCLSRNEEANGLAGLPLSGRNKIVLSGYIHQYGWVYGNFYAIRGSHLKALAAHNIKLPVGLVGDDGYVGNFVRLNFETFDIDDIRRVMSNPLIGYHFESFKLNSLEGLASYINRYANYYIRQKQFSYLEGIRMNLLPASTREMDKKILYEIEEKSFASFSPILRAAKRKLIARARRGYLP